MKKMTLVAIVAALAACKTPAETDAPSEPETAAETAANAEKKVPAETDEKPEEAAGQSFTPTKIPGTPHDEEGTAVALAWAGEPAEVGLYKSVGVPSAAVTRVAYEKGDAIEYEKSIVLVTKPTELVPTGEQAKFTSAASFEPVSGSLSEASRDEVLQSGDTAYLLKYAGEGTCYVQRNDDVFFANCPGDDFEKHERKPQEFEWWVLVKSDSGGGWLEVDDRVDVEVKSTM